ncbi:MULTISPECIES: YkgJ family cysteine cluster protein [unclassified Variovorax]|uniref:YkgJ family cysteine cluster protein n=1 Tax=unclassified Variovorax TaxID=663243 RepID=UPI001BD49A0F|nr:MULTISPECIES: YkgJ family cysteine cluster protein [unclassified Variovorax]
MATGTDIAAVPGSAPGDGTDASLTSRQRARLPLATQRADRKLDAIASNSAAQLLVQASQRAATVVQCIAWLHKAATAWGEPLEAVSACRKGCAHCCHIPVTITGSEAKLIARASGRGVRTPPRGVRVQDLVDAESTSAATRQLQQWPAGVACPFLSDAMCSVYAARPLACRVLFNMDDDDLLCQHGDGEPAQVPYADARMLRALALAAQPAEVLADIRAFFPPGER